MMGTARLVCGLALGLLLGCSDETASNPIAGAGGGGGAGGAPTCPPGSVLEADACIAAGVGRCAAGFEANGRGGCQAILPADACPSGELALPGETRCHPVGDDCGAPPWGNIPIDATTRYVDASYTGTDSDGSAAKPWPTIQQAIFAAQLDDTIAVAEGTYPEALLTGGGRYRLWGRCPSLVTVVSDAPWEAVVIDASGTEIHNLALSGHYGAGVYYAGDALLEDVWIHDTTLDGILTIGDDASPTKVTMRDSLIENSGGAGILLIATDATVERSVVRDVVGSAEPATGRGIHVEDDAAAVHAPVLEVTSSIVERAREVGIIMYGGELTLDASLVRDISAKDNVTWGVGVAVQRTTKPATAIVDGAVIQHTVMFGLSVVDAEVETRSTTIEDVSVESISNGFGDGVVIIDSQHSGARVTISNSRLAGAARAGVACFSASVVLAGVALECNTLHLDGEKPYGDFSFDNAGSNACWCGDEAEDCKVLSAGIQPPLPL